MKVYKKLFSYVPHYMAWGYLAILTSVVSAVLLVVGYYYIYEFFYWIIVKGSYVEGYERAKLLLIFLITSVALYMLSSGFSHKFAFRLETNLRKRGIDGLTGASFRFFDLNSSGYIRKTIDDNAAKTHSAVAHMLPDNCQAFLVPVLSIFLAFYINVKVGVIVVALTLVCGLILKSMMGGEENFMELYQESLGRLSAEIVEYVRGIQVVKIFGGRLNSFKALKAAIEDYSTNAYKYSLSCKNPYVIYQLIFLGVVAILAIPLSFFMKPDELATLGGGKEVAIQLIMIFFLSGIMMVSFMKVMWAGQDLFDANYAIDQLEALYDKMHEAQLDYGTKSSFDNCNIEFDHVTFSYGNNKVFEDLSLCLEEKKTYALVGGSGSGKSTLTKLLSGFYKVDSGHIKIGGHPICQYSKDAIIKGISFVFQDSKLFKTTIYENVALAKEGATREEILRALNLAGCDEILDKFRQRENTVIGSKGVYLSGGEKQRIAIARAILKDSPIVVMDEASASIDPDNEHKLQKAFSHLMKDKTVIMIGHRMSTIKNVDEILVLEKGKVVERGNNKELTNMHGRYETLLKLYETANEWRVSHEELS